MTVGYLAVGHGRKPGGAYDPGALTKKTATTQALVEHELAHLVTAACAVALKRSGVTNLIVESDGGVGHDPSFEGSVKRANDAKAAWAIEIHFNKGGGTGPECWIFKPGGKAEQMAKAIMARLPKALGLKSRGVKSDEKFSFTKNTKMPAVIVEVAFLDGDNAMIAADRAAFCAKAGEAIAHGLCDFLGVKYAVAAAPKPQPSATPIMGAATASAAAIEKWFVSKKKAPKLTGGTTLRALVEMYLAEGADEGVRGDVAFVQACKETGYFTYGGDVKPEQNNFCGLGATGGGAGGAAFPDARTGVRAHVQHLRAYADPAVTKQKLAHACVDPRFDKVSPKGKARTWVALGGTWAVPGKGYGEEIMKLFTEIK